MEGALPNRQKGDAASGTVLVVDDEPRNVQLMQDLLESRGYLVWTAADGEQGIAIARERSPDVVLLDVMMPRLNGFEVCRQLKSGQSTAMIPVLLVTALDARQDRLAGIGAGANDFIAKPIDSGDLLLRVRNAVTTKRLYDQVSGQFRKLQELEAARDTLTHMIVHDLRSPLTGLQAYLDLLGMAAAENAKEEVLDFAREANVIAGQLKELVSQVLDVSRLESGQMPLDSTETDLVRLVPAAVAGVGPAPAGVRISYQMPERATVVTCDPSLISRVITNLVGNAYKFTPHGGTVSVGLEHRNGDVRLTVTDDGPGIPAEFHEVIFQKFGQTPLGRAAPQRSAGLGLAFCKLAVQAHQGSIGVETASTGGARFWVHLPVVAPAGGAPS